MSIFRFYSSPSALSRSLSLSGEILYTAATSNFLGTMYDISRATGIEQERIRTEQSINWLSGKTLIHPSRHIYTLKATFNVNSHPDCL